MIDLLRVYNQFTGLNLRIAGRKVKTGVDFLSTGSVIPFRSISEVHVLDFANVVFDGKPGYNPVDPSRIADQFHRFQWMKPVVRIGTDRRLVLRTF